MATSYNDGFGRFHGHTPWTGSQIGRDVMLLECPIHEGYGAAGTKVSDVVGGLGETTHCEIASTTKPKKRQRQHQVLRIAERTLALPYGRAMSIFGSLPTVKREAYIIPKMEYNIRLRRLS